MSAKKEVPECVWTGVSGTQYQYFVYQLPVNFTPNVDGNYIFTKIVENKWLPIYIGEGCLADRICDAHHQSKCISSKGATHVHVHASSNKVASRTEEADLLAGFSQAYAPNGCNIKVGG